MKASLNNQRHAILTVVIIAVVVIGLAFAFFVGNRQKATAAYCSSREQAKNTTESNPLIKRAVETIQFNNNLDELESLTNEIKITEDYNNNANCLYPLVVYENRLRNFSSALAYAERIQDLERQQNHFLFDEFNVTDLDFLVNNIKENTELEGDETSGILVVPEELTEMLGR